MSYQLGRAIDASETLPAVFAKMRDKGQGPWLPEILEEDARRLADFERAHDGVTWEELKTWRQSWDAPIIEAIQLIEFTQSAAD